MILVQISDNTWLIQHFRKISTLIVTNCAQSYYLSELNTNYILVKQKLQYDRLYRNDVIFVIKYFFSAKYSVTIKIYNMYVRSHIVKCCKRSNEIESKGIQIVKAS